MFGVDGIIGSDLFASTIVSIDSQTKNIIVTSAEKPSTVSLRKMLNFTKEGGMPIVNVQIAPVSNITVLLIQAVPVCYLLLKVILRELNRRHLWKSFLKDMGKEASE